MWGQCGEESGARRPKRKPHWIYWVYSWGLKPHASSEKQVGEESKRR
jgi:hypothetical protein